MCSTPCRSKMSTCRARCTACGWSAICRLARLPWPGCRRSRPDVVLTPNGSILEMGAVYQVARYLGIPVVTYEFGEQRGRIWLAQNDEVMRQETDDLWQARQDQPLDEAQWEQIRSLFASRQQGRPVGELLPPLARATQPGRRAGAPGAGSGSTPGGIAGSQCDRRQPDPGPAGIQPRA